MPTALPPVPQADWDAHANDQFDNLTKDAESRIAALTQQEEQAAAEPARIDAAAEQDWQAQSAQMQARVAGLQQAEAAPEQEWQQQSQAMAARVAQFAQSEQYPGDQGSSPMSPNATSMSPNAPTGALQDYARAAATKAGIDPEMFVRQIQQESGFNPTAKSGAGAQGIAQIVPQYHPGVDTSDPRASLDYAANWMGQLTKQYGGDQRKALVHYNGGGGAVAKLEAGTPYDESSRYLSAIDTGQQGEKAPQTSTGERSRVEAVGQFEQGLSAEDAYSICGPVAALAFAQANGRNPDLGEARRLAKQVGWTSAGGMNGVQNQQRLLTEMGVASKLDTNPDFGHIAEDASSGNPVIISTPVHYYFVNGYDKATGQLHVGKTGEARKGGGSWMSAQQIATLDGGINGALFVDNPQSPTPSVAAAPAEDTSQLGPLGGPGGSQADAPTGFAPIGAVPRAGAAPVHAPTGQIEPTLPGVTVESVANAGGDLLVGQMEQANKDRATAAAHFTGIADKLQRGESVTQEEIDRGLALVEPMAVGATEPLNVGGAVAGKVAGVVGGQIERLRLDKFPEAVQSTIEQAATDGAFWRTQRRGVIPDAQAEHMADQIGKSVDTMIAGGGLGRAYNTEETRALRNAVTGQALIVDDLAAAVERGVDVTPAMHADLARAEARLSDLSRIVEGARAEAGRSFRAYVMNTRDRVKGDPTAMYRLPVDAGRAAPEMGPGAQQQSAFPPPEHYRAPVDPGVAAPDLGKGVEQSTPFGSTDYYRQPTDPGQAAPPNPGSSTPKVTEQAPLTLEPVASTGRATNLVGETTTVGAGKMSIYDRASIVRMAGMLSGIPTHLLNVGGNVVMGGATLAMKEGQIGVDLARVGVGRALGKDVVRQRFQAEMGPQIAGYGRGVWAGLQQVPGILVRGATEAQLANINAPSRGLRSGSKVVDAAVEAPLRALAASDAIFRTAAFGGHSAALAVRQATQEGLSGAARTARVQEILGNISDHPKLLEQANNLAARDVFQEARGVTDAIGAFKREHVAAQVAGDIILPFYKTPYNVAAQGAGMTPLGLGSVLAAARRGETGEAVDRAVRATIGTGALGIGLMLARSQMLTGPYPTDAGERSTLPEGWKPYAIRVPSGDGAVYIPIQALGAFAVPLGVAANMDWATQKGHDTGDVYKSTLRGLGAIGQFMGDMSALQGLNSVTKLITTPERSLEAFAESLAASFVPDSAMMRNIQQALGDAARNPGNPFEAFMAAIPGLSKYVPEARTSLGDTRTRGTAGPMAIVSGSRIGVELPDATLKTLRDADVNIPAPPKTVGKGNAPLTEAEQQRYQKIAGDLIRSSVAGMTSSDTFNSASLASRKKALEASIERNRTAAEQKMIADIGSAEMSRRYRELTGAKK